MKTQTKNLFAEKKILSGLAIEFVGIPWKSKHQIVNIVKKKLI